MSVNIPSFVGSKIKDYRRKEKLSQKELGEIVGVKHNTISSYESGNNEPVHSVLYKIANALNVSINDFFPSEEEIVRESSFTYNYFPTAISAGLPIEIDGVTDTEKISLPDSIMGKWSGDSNIFVSKINGQSMNNVMPDGSLIAVKPITLHSLKNGDIVVFSNNHEYSVKRYYKFDDVVVFRPDSNNLEFYETRINIDEVDNLEIHGKVVLYTVELD